LLKLRTFPKELKRSCVRFCSYSTASNRKEGGSVMLTVWSLLLLTYFIVAIGGVLLLAYYTVVGMMFSELLVIVPGQNDQTFTSEQATAEMASDTIEESKPAGLRVAIQAKQEERKPLPVSYREVRKNLAERERRHVGV